MLPRTSRFILVSAPAAEWDWDKETQSRILAKLDFILVTLQNAFRDKKKSSQVKHDEQWQPECVKEAKEEAQRKKRQKLSDEDLAALKAYYKAKNSGARFIDD